MPIETDHHTPWSRERYRFHPWYDRPLTDRQLRVVLLASLLIAAVLAVGSGIAVWLAGWAARWLVEPIVLLILMVLAGAGRDAWADSCVTCAPKMAWRADDGSGDRAHEVSDLEANDR